MHGTADLANARMADHSRYARQVALESQARTSRPGPTRMETAKRSGGRARLVLSFAAAILSGRI